MKISLFAFIISVLFLVNGCETENKIAAPDAKSDGELYAEAVYDAMISDSSEVSTKLVAITPGNSYLEWSDGYVLVVTWTKYGSSYPEGDTISTWWGDTWVTAVPELQDWFMKNPVSTEKVINRAEQLLGLPGNSGYKYFAELWVRPDDLLRPAYDNKIDDNTCGLSFPANTSEDYILWFNNNIIYSYYPQNNSNKYPWTRLGYTYDWGNPNNEKGLSEFIIKKNASVIVKSLHSTNEYIH